MIPRKSMKIELRKETVKIDIRNGSWVLNEENSDGFRLTLTYNRRKLQLFIYLTNTLTLIDFKSNSAAPAIAKGRSNQLKPTGIMSNVGRIPDVYWQELSKYEHPFSVEGNYIRYYAGFADNPFKKPNLYLYASLEYDQQLEGNEHKYLDDFFTILRDITFEAPSRPSVAASTASNSYQSPDSREIKLSGHRLERIDSYNSGSYSGGGGYSIQETIDLFADHSCKYHYTSIISGSSYGGISLGGGFKEEKTTGIWKIAGDSLILELLNGNRKEWDLGINAGYAWLGNQKYHIIRM